MREVVDFRIPEDEAQRRLGSHVGTSLGGTVRQVEADTSSDLFHKIGMLQHEYAEKGGFFFLGYSYHRTYTSREIDDAALFLIRPRKWLDFAAEEYETRYDESKSCSECGAGAVQQGDLRVDRRLLPKSAQLASTFADELLIGGRLRRQIIEEDLVGPKLGGVRAHASSDRLDAWSQLLVAQPTAILHDRTIAGRNPFDIHSYGKCSRGDTVGLNLLSEVTVAAQSISANADVFESVQHVGHREGLLRPFRLLFVAGETFRRLDWMNHEDICFEVAYIK